MKKLIGNFFALLLLLLLVTCSTSVHYDQGKSNSPIEAKGSQSSKAAAASNFKIVGYFPDWASSADVTQFNKLTHLNYAFVIPNTDGSLKPLGNPNLLKTVVSRAHANNVKVLIAVGGWSWQGTPLDQTFETLAKNPTSRNALINNLINFVNQYNLDGVDMDWEFPDPPMEGNGSADAFSALMIKLTNEMHSRGKLCTAAVHAGATPDIDDFYWAYGVKDDVLQTIDFINIMAYDGGDGDRHSPYSLAQKSLNYWVNIRGCAKEKAILGVPFYGRPSWKTYKELVAQDSQAPYKDIVGNVHYNGINTIKRKTQLAKSNGGGIMIWELAQDTMDHTSLLSAIYAAAGGVNPSDDKIPPTVPGNLTGTGGTGSAALNWSASTDNKGVAGYKIYKNNVYLQSVSSTSVTLTGLAQGTYSFKVSAYDAANNESGKSNSVSVTVQAGGGTTYPQWEKSKVYNGGNRVSWKGHNWEAKWWTQGEEPGATEWGPWKKIDSSTPGNDTQAPSTPANLQASVNSSSVSLSWSASTDNKGVTGYKVYQNDSYVKTVTGTSTTVDNLAAGTYHFKVSAVDAANNESGKSNSVSATVTDGGSSTYPQWEASKVYNGGDRVSWKGHNWEAKWWTQGDEPKAVDWGPWKDLGAQ